MGKCALHLGLQMTFLKVKCGCSTLSGGSDVTPSKTGNQLFVTRRMLSMKTKVKANCTPN